MIKDQIAVTAFITSIILLPGFTNNTGQQYIFSKKISGIISNDRSAELPKISIANVRVVKSDKGQKPVEVMVMLSQASADPVTVEYKTKDGTASAGTDYVATSGSLTFAPGETMKRINVLIVGEVAAEADEDAPMPAETGFAINLSNVKNAILQNASAIITIIGNVLKDPRYSTGNRSVYEVRFIFTGAMLMHGTLSDCPVRSNGKVVLTGLLEGNENLSATNYDDIEYRGTLQLDIDVDICSAKGEGDNAKLCNITVMGSGPVKAQLDIYYDGRGGYIKINDTTSYGFSKNAVGSCDGLEVAEERTMIPLKTIATIFNGLELPMLTQRTLREGPSQILQIDGGEVLVEVIRKLR